MSEIKYIKGSLFDAPKDNLLIHACNAKGVWDSGIAKEFKTRYPKAFKEYNEMCLSFNMIGTAGEWQNIAWLVTSSGYASTLDDKDSILVHTTLALDNLILHNGLTSDDKIASNKFNSGLFKVPWEETERILKVFVKKYNLDWTVYEKE